MPLEKPTTEHKWCGGTVYAFVTEFRKWTHEAPSNAAVAVVEDHTTGQIMTVLARDVRFQIPESGGK
jgi:hypothetical protein